MTSPTQRPLKVVTDSTADLPHALSRELGIEVVPLIVSFGNEHYRDGLDLSGEEFYRKLTHSKAMPATAAPAPGAFAEVYERCIADGYDVLSIHLSSDLSGVYNAAMVAAADFNYEVQRVAVVDSRALSMSVGWLAIHAAHAAREHHDLAYAATLVEDMIPRLRILGAFDTLAMLQRGGRIGMASAFLGTMLSVKPLLHMKEGLIEPLERVRTSSKALTRMADIVRGFGPLQACAVMHGYNEEAAHKLVELISPHFPVEQILLTHVGAVLGTHVGPKAVGVACVLASGLVNSEK